MILRRLPTLPEHDHPVWHEREIRPDRLESIQNRYLDGRPVSNCGQETASEIDQEVMKMLKDAYEEAKRLLSQHRGSLDKIAAFPDRERNNHRQGVHEYLPRSGRDRSGVCQEV